MRMPNPTYRDDMVRSTRASAYTMARALAWMSSCAVHKCPSVRETTNRLGGWRVSRGFGVFRTSNREARLIASRFIACRMGGSPIRSQSTPADCPSQEAIHSGVHEMPRYLRSSLSEITPPHYATPLPARRAAETATSTVRNRAAARATAALQARVPNPLWAINIGMGFFFALAAVVIMLD